MRQIQTLNSEISRFEHLRRQLLEDYPEIDEETLADTLEGATDLNEAISAIVRSALDDEAMAEALKTRMDDMKVRLERIRTTASNKRLAATDVMEQVGLKKVTEADFTVSLRPAPLGVIITNEEAIPDAFKVPQPARIDKRRILDHLKHGESVTGATLTNQRNSLSVRTK
jgi:hypothetical protein